VTSITGGTFCLNPLSLDYPILETVQSALNFCDEVVVVDAGSTDGTIEKLKSISARIKIYPTVWQYKFKRWSPTNHAEAFIRNKVLENCGGDWIFFFDTDEIIHETFHSTIKEMVQTKDYDMYDIYMDHLYRCKRDGKYQIFLKTRENTGIKRRLMLYRNHLGNYYGRLRKNSHSPHQDLIGVGKQRTAAIKKLRVFKPEPSVISVLHYGQCRLERCVARSLNLWGIRYTQDDTFRELDEETHTLEDRGYPLFVGTHPLVMQDWIKSRT